MQNEVGACIRVNPGGTAEVFLRLCPRIVLWDQGVFSCLLPRINRLTEKGVYEDDQDPASFVFDRRPDAQAVVQPAGGHEGTARSHAQSGNAAAHDRTGPIPDFL